MTLHAVVYQQHQDLPFAIHHHHHHHNNPSLYDHLINHDDGFYDHHQPSLLFDDQYDDTFNFPFCNNNQSSLVDAQCFDWSYDDDQQMWGPNSTTLRDPQAADVSIDKDEDGEEKVRPKRRRTRMKKKNKEDIESQRMTHIAVERNRRKQMNDYLSVLRSLMPHSYVPRGDQASIVGGAINFVKELEQNLHCLTAAKNQMHYENNEGHNINYGTSSNSLPFGEFFTFPQYSTTTGGGGGGDSHSSGDDDGEPSVKGSVSHHLHHHGRVAAGGGLAADVEVTMVESHALIKIRTIQPPKQLSKLVSGLQGLGLNILHLNTTKVDGVAFYSFSVKVEDEGRLSSVDEIASAVYQLLSGLQ